MEKKDERGGVFFFTKGILSIRQTNVVRKKNEAERERESRGFV